MRCISALSTARTMNAAFHQILEKLEGDRGDGPADLCVIFSSMHHADEVGRMAALLIEQGRALHVLGCTAESVAGESREVEGAPALAVLALDAPGISIEPIRLDGPDPSPTSFASLVGDDPSGRALILLADPFSFRTDEFLRAVNEELRGLRVVGGMASGSQVPRGNQLILDDQAYLDGAVAMLLGGPIGLRTLVSQGCRPVGHTMIVTGAENNVIRELGRRPALEALRAMFQELPPDDRRRIQDGLHIGRVINEFQGEFGRGDFLVRNVMGADDSGAIQINDVVRVGKTIQFHVRDAETADDDLRLALLRVRDDPSRTSRPAGALLFSCNGRGTRLFDGPDHDVRTIRDVFPDLPVAGFFAMGEIGPVGGQNFVHGYTASILLFECPA
ncbi:FIST N domain protein [Aquisphaera giovannonii]|uniref:FIST N domain protein n=1 Tax=Aquisphaera giovannonii TaxID=406548 RepID=A0A5B9WAQ3_9BACT|nr:FIST N-terminal domain-containing protein [Aquisphaera giovannonii]QEH37656.1 FIST N domain protein [Aquisphaera giovannonii]